MSRFFFFFFQAEDGIRDLIVTGVQTCALPISFDARGTLGAGTDLGDLREVTAEGKLQRHAAPAAGGQRRAPPGAIGREIEHRTHARVLEQRAAVAHRVLLRRRRQLVPETLYREYAARRTDPTPPPRR